jgi:hypothetical protein
LYKKDIEQKERIIDEDNKNSQVVMPNSIKKIEFLLDSGNYPDYINVNEVTTAFGCIFVELEYREDIEEYGKIINVITFYKIDNACRKEIIGQITKDGLLNANTTEPIFPFGFRPSSNFMKNHFIGFSEDVIKCPFLINGIAYDTLIGYYKTELLIQLDLDYSNKKLKLFSFVGEP